MTKKQTKSAGKAPRGAARKAPPRPTKAVRARKPATPRERDPRLPAAGTTLVRTYKGRDHRVTVLDQGFLHDGSEYRSLSKLASVLSGQPSVNGYLWFGLTGRKATERSPLEPKPAAPATARRAKSAPQKEGVPEAVPGEPTVTA